MNNDFTKVSPLVPSQLPEFVRVDHPSLVAFLSAYYEWMEQNGQILTPMALRGVADVDETMERFVSQFKDQFLLDFPETLAVSKDGTPVDARRLVKNIKAFYRAKGTEKAYQFLFRILYDTNVEFYYPKRDILRLSDGKWIKRSSIRTTNSIGSRLSRIGGYRVYQRNNAGSIVASARVDTVSTLQIGFYDIAEIFLTGINGTFTTDRRIEFFDGTDTLFESSILPVVGNVSIGNGGSDYKVGDKVVFTAAVGDTGRGAYGIVSAVSTTGEITKIQVQNFGVNYRTAPTVSVVSTRGSGFAGTVAPAAVCAYDGYYAGNDGRLSTNKVLQDNHFYQNFSYVLLTEVTIDKYRDAIRRLIHPAGLGFFGQVSIKRCNRAELSHHSELDRYEVPIIGNYAPYTFKTFDDFSSWFEVNGVVVGYDPNVHDTLILGATGNPVTAGATAGAPVTPLSTPNTAGDPFWIVYTHPNRKIRDTAVARIWQEDKNDFLFEGEGGTSTGDYSNAWHEWTMTGSQRSAWDGGFTGDSTYAILRYDSRSQFQRITARAFFEMPIGARFDCRSERIETPSVPSLNLIVSGYDLSPEVGAMLVSNGAVNIGISIDNLASLEWYTAQTIRLVVLRNGTTFREVSLPTTTTKTKIQGLSDGQYTAVAALLDRNGDLIAGSTSNTLSFAFLYNPGSTEVGNTTA